MVKKMAANPLILALASPARRSRRRTPRRRAPTASSPPAAPTTPNQVNNVLVFPYIFRGALDSGATTITVEMEIAAVYALAELAQAEQSEVVAAAYAGQAVLRPRVPDPRSRSTRA